MAICGGSWCRCGRFRDNDRDSGGICKKGWHECEILCRWLWKYIFSFFLFWGGGLFFFLLIFCIKGFLGKKMICSLSFFFANLYFIYKSWFWPLLFGANEFVNIFFSFAKFYIYLLRKSCEYDMRHKYYFSQIAFQFMKWTWTLRC